LPLWLAIEPRWGVAGLTASAGVAGWVEFTFLRRALNTRIGATGLPFALAFKLWGGAATGAAAGWAVKLAIGSREPWIEAVLVLGTYGVVYFAVAWVLRIEECRDALGRVLRFTRRRGGTL